MQNPHRMRLQGAIEIKNRDTRHPWLEYHDALIMKERLTPVCKQANHPGARTQTSRKGSIYATTGRSCALIALFTNPVDILAVLDKLRSHTNTMRGRGNHSTAHHDTGVEGRALRVF